jgi:hypothetical protein
MMFFRSTSSYEELGDQWVAYRKYLFSVQGRLPVDVFEFATARWHYDPADHRSLHDSWLQDMTVAEEQLEGAEESGRRRTTIELVLLAPYHDGVTTLFYSNVEAYTLSLQSSGEPNRHYSTHGDWLVDEIRLSEQSKVLHEISFSSGAHFLIECETIRHATSAPATKEA